MPGGATGVARGGRWRGGWVGANFGVNQFFPRNGGSTRCAHSFNKLLSSPALHGAAPSINFVALVFACCAALHCLAVLCLFLLGRALLCAALCIVLRCSADGFPLRSVRPLVSSSCLFLPVLASFSLLPPVPVVCWVCIVALRCIALHSFGDFLGFFPRHITWRRCCVLSSPRLRDCCRRIVQPIHHTFNKLRYLSRSGTDRFVGPQRASSADRNRPCVSFCLMYGTHQVSDERLR